MSPWHTCQKCKIYVIGNEKHGCIVCHKANVSRIINYRKYRISLSRLPIPIDIIMYISSIACQIEKYQYLVDIHEMSWKARMHGLMKCDN